MLMFVPLGKSGTTKNLVHLGSLETETMMMLAPLGKGGSTKKLVHLGS